MKYFREKGFSILEMVITIIIFSLFLAGLYATVDIGLKSWQMGETRTDMIQKGETIIRRMISDITMTNSIAVQVNEYNISFESAYKDNKFQIDNNILGSPVWQGHIIYFTYPDPADITAKVPTQGRSFYRKYKPHSPTSVATIINLTGILNPSKGSGETLSKMSDGLDRAIFEQNHNVILIKLLYKKKLKANSRVTISGAQNFEETMELNAAVEPKN